MLLEMITAQVCLELEGDRREACHRAIEAATVQHTAVRDVRAVEDKAVDLAKSRLTAVTGERALAVTLYVAKVIRDKEVSANLVRPNGQMPSTSVRAGENGYRVNFSWSF